MWTEDFKRDLVNKTPVNHPRTLWYAIRRDRGLSLRRCFPIIEFVTISIRPPILAPAFPHSEANVLDYRGTSLIRKCIFLGPTVGLGFEHYDGPGGGAFIISEEPMYDSVADESGRK